jgi:hypothetical protein
LFVRCGLAGRCRAQIDHTESVPVRIGEYDEVRIRRVQVPVDSGGAEADEPFDLHLLLGAPGIPV